MTKSTTNSPQTASRRQFLGRSVVAVGTCAAVLGAGDSLAALPKPEQRTLRMVNVHTWEKLDIVYYIDGMYIDESLQKIDYVMRDRRSGKTHRMDINLLDDLERLHSSFNTKERIHLLSGYRTPETNAKLRKRSKGVAKYSLHMEGRAADIYIPGIKTRHLQRAALDMRAGGVGFYKKSHFVHIDTGRVRHWER